MVDKLVTAVLKDGREFEGHVVIDGAEVLDLVFQDGGVGHQVSIPKELVDRVVEHG